MIPHTFRKKNSHEARQLNREANRMKAQINRVMRRRARKGYGCDPKALLLRMIDA